MVAGQKISEVTLSVCSLLALDLVDILMGGNGDEMWPIQKRITI